MKKLFAMLACCGFLAMGPCTVDSWNLAVNPGVHGRNAFVGVELDLGGFDLVLPLSLLVD